MSDFFDALRSNNRDLFQRLRLIFRNYWMLIFCEIGEVIRHGIRSFQYKDGELAKSGNHLKNICAADPVRFFMVHRYLTREARKRKNKKN